jgi:hypothetical protein
MFSPADIYLDNNGNRYSTLVTLKFNEFAISLPKGETSTSIDQIRFPEVKNFMNTLVKKYGGLNLVKAIPSAIWGDTIRINKRTGKTIYIKDMSQIFTLKFTNLVPVDSIASMLGGLPNIEYAVGPNSAYLTTSPNDPYYQDNNYRWSFDAINASQAWDITKGSSNIRVSLNDQFNSLGQIHEDLIDKVVYRFSPTASGGHGNITAGVVGASTNNNSDIASLGWNTSVMFNNWDNDDEVNRAVLNGADVINFSWITPNYDPSLAIAIHNALLQGVVCVAAAGNNEVTPPSILYPASLNFGNDGQVIAVSGTEINNGTEIFIPGFNYSPGTDPENDRTRSFIDCSAPGTNYRGLNDLATTGTVHIFSGTSISAPFVSALVSLILSINNSLIPIQIYDVITKSADKIGQYKYNSIGWNQYLGYGRINAYNALQYTLEHYGGAVQGISIPKGGTNPTSFSLLQNYPDPFNPSTKINFSIPKSGYVTLKVYDILGKEIVSLVNEYKTQGNYSVDFNPNIIARGLSSGIYIYQLIEDNDIQTKKMVLLK